jgi:spore germination protein KC
VADCRHSREKGGAGLKHRKVKLFLSVLMLMLAVMLTSGCWDRIELEERAIVLGIGIDLAKQEAEQQELRAHEKEFKPPGTALIHLSVQLAVPGRIPLGPGTGSGQEAGGRGQGQTVWVLDVVGHTVDEAVSNLQQQLSSALFFGHLRVIAISEEVAKQGLQNINDYFRRNPEVRRTTWMVVCKGEARDLMKAAPQLERIPTLFLIHTMEQATKLGKFPEQFAGIFWSQVYSKGQEGFLPYVELKENDNVQISGMAIFKGYKMVEATTPFDVILYMGIKGINPGGYQNFVKVPGEPGYVVFAGTRRRSKISVNMEDGQPHVSVKIMIEGDLRGKTNEQFKINNDVIQKIEKVQREKAKKSYMDLIRKTQEKQVDIFGFGEYIRAKEANYWNENIRTKEEWQKQYRNLSVDVNVQFEIRRIGMKGQ